jgi:hypothetical protein
MADRAVAGRLTRNAGSYAGNGGAPLGRDDFSALVALVGTFAARKKRPRKANGVFDAIVNLILHRAVPRPSASHRHFLSLN